MSAFLPEHSGFWIRIVLALAFVVPSQQVAFAQLFDTASSERRGSDRLSVSTGNDDPIDDLGALDIPDIPDIDGLDELLDVGIEELGQVDVVVPVLGEEVTTVSRQESTVGRSPAAIYVITNDMIRRSGARSIPEALRLAPGVQVSRINSSSYAISIRGFNQRYANKLLVQIDGRTVYTPLFGGVFWDVQDVLLEDVDRIEIIRGPGASVWGVNAVNGIINVITKHSDETLGLFADVGGGDERGFASTRIGGVSDYGTWRVYGKWFERQDAFTPLRTANDSWTMDRIGFRMDLNPSCCETLTIQGDYYDGVGNETRVRPLPAFPFASSDPSSGHRGGGNVLVRWTEKMDEFSTWSLQLYYDRTERSIDELGWREDRDTIDIDYQQSFQPSSRHSLIFGFGYRNSRDRIRNNAFSLSFLPPNRADDTLSTFLQDEISLVDEQLSLIVGSKFSWNDYSGFEAQPTARLLHTPSPRQSYWASFSRAVRVPTRSSDDILALTPPTNVPVFPTFFQVTGNRSVESEEMMAWEIGMREAPTDYFFWDIAFFYNQYNDLQSLRTGAPFVNPNTGLFTIPLTFINGSDADGYGFELASTWEVRPGWSLRGGYSFLKLDIHPAANAFAQSTSAEGESPRNQAFVHSSWDIGCNWELDLIGRYMDTLPAIGIPSYLTADARVAWRPNPHLEFAVIGRHLLDGHHPEQASDSFVGALRTEVQREVYGVLTIRR